MKQVQLFCIKPLFRHYHVNQHLNDIDSAFCDVIVMRQSLERSQLNLELV